MAPEQLEGQPATIASDLYAVGLILFEIWSGRLPLTLDPLSWYFGRSLFVLLLIAATALFAFWRSLGGKPILPGPVFAD